LTHDIRKRTSSGVVKRFADMEFIAFKMGFRTGAKAEKLRSQAALDATYGLLPMQYGSHRQQTESVSFTGFSLILDPVRIFDGTAKHLKTAADTD
jgi:hypothetical protein